MYSKVVFLLLQIVVTLCQLTPDLVDVKNYFGRPQCLETVAEEEAVCHKRHLDSVATITGKRGPKQESDEYKKLVCCDVWRYVDCLLIPVRRKCSSEASEAVSSLVETANDLTVYCADYPYGCVRCWRFPWWAWLLSSLAIVGVVGVGVTGVWFWRQNHITYWRIRRKY